MRHAVVEERLWPTRHVVLGGHSHRPIASEAAHRAERGGWENAQTKTLGEVRWLRHKLGKNNTHLGGGAPLEDGGPGGPRGGGGALYTRPHRQQHRHLWARHSGTQQQATLV